MAERMMANYVADMAKWPDDRRDRPGARHRRAAAAVAAPGPGHEPGRGVGRDGHLGQHAVPAGVGPAPGHPGAAAPARPRLPGQPGPDRDGAGGRPPGAAEFLPAARDDLL